MLFLNLYRIIDMINHKSKLVCPHCSHEKTITMPSTFCQYFLECTNCKTVIKAKAGDCCVFCSYGDIKCPPIQKNSGEWVCVAIGLFVKLRYNHLDDNKVYQSLIDDFFISIGKVKN